MQGSLKRELTDSNCIPDNAKRIKVSEELGLHQELRKVTESVLPGPTFYPSLDEFEDPLMYIAKIRPLAEKFGICKIVPPQGWVLPERDRDSKPTTFVARVQNIHALRSGRAFPDGNTYTYHEYRDEMNYFKATRFPDLVYSKENHIRAKKYPKRQKNSTSVERQPCVSQSLFGDSHFVMCKSCGNVSTVQAKSDSDNHIEKLRATFDCKSCLDTSLIEDFSYPIEETYWYMVKNQGRTRNPMSTEGCFASRIPVRLTVEYANDQDVQKVQSTFPDPPEWPLSSQSMTPRDDRNANNPVSRRMHIPGKLKAKFDDPQYYTMTPWNLNSMPFLPGSLLKYLPQGINGLTHPWLYMGGLFSTFAWHNEDHYLYSVNYMAKGEGKVWYGVPGSQTRAFEQKMLSVLSPEVIKKNPKIIYSITAMIPPDELADENIQICRLVQEPGTFIITFPAAYHGGFSCGWNVAEAVNMALPDWLPYGREAMLNFENREGARRGRPPCFSHDRLVLSLVRGALDDIEDEMKQLEKNHLTLLQREFSHVIQQEIFRRESTNIMHRVKDKVSLSEEDDTYKRECRRCRNFCYFSAVSCGSCPQDGRRKKFSCLLHAETHCNRHDNLQFYEWVPLTTLSDLSDQIDTRLRNE